MGLQAKKKQSYLLNSPSILVLLILIPLFLVSFFASPFSSSWKKWDFLTSYSLNLFDDENNANPSNTSSGALDGSLSAKLVGKEPSHNNDRTSFEKKKAGLEGNLSKAEMRGFVPKLKRYLSKSERLEAILAKARSSIRKAARNNSSTSIYQDLDYVPQGPIYRNPNSFHRSYLLMEKMFKIYVYQEGEPPIYHNGPCKSIYSTEGMFIHELEKGNFYRTNDPDEAFVFFLPFSVVVMVHYLYVPGAHDMHPIGRTVADYIDTISGKHPFWNRTLGADHFMLSCHDWGPYSTSYVPHLFSKSIRVLCNANTSEGFNPLKDVSLPEINLKTGELTGLIGGPPPSERPILAFFAGGLHGHIRYLLLEHWKEKDQDVQVYGKLPPNISYESKLKNSKYCLCASGYEVASPRVVEAIYAECVPVLISDGYVPPLSDVLNWEAFSVTIQVKDIPNIKKILMEIPVDQYLAMQKGVKQVQRHFAINRPPKRFDLFHMIMHSVWLRRLNMRLQRSQYR